MPFLALVAGAQRLDDTARNGADVDGKEGFRRFLRQRVGGLECGSRVCLPVGQAQVHQVAPAVAVFGLAVAINNTHDAVRRVVSIEEDGGDCVLDFVRVVDDLEGFFLIEPEAGERERNTHHADLADIVATARAGIVFAAFDHVAVIANAALTQHAERDRNHAESLRDSAGREDSFELVHESPLLVTMMTRMHERCRESI
ncbi:hypothetical protein AGR3A_Cc420195 [Agrobacterium tomkonis CFBP 6623]|uniref:Uncharacterized protein n=1 Tax=Agrobacterium tomkonis CFBP 6623 TaxID=1183432 RepID=A0A1S7QBJ8_9HYPH|nr:hypothetical protein AGR3A_Cc420195 [Agrobacterium tomkonis CFBP 6623]